MPVVTLDVPGRDEIEAKALIYEALKAYAEARLSAAALPQHARSYRHEMSSKAAQAAQAALSLYPGDRAVAADLHEVAQAFRAPAAVLPIEGGALPAERGPAPSKGRPGSPARAGRRDRAS